MNFSFIIIYGLGCVRVDFVGVCCLAVPKDRGLIVAPFVGVCPADKAFCPFGLPEECGLMPYRPVRRCPGTGVLVWRRKA